MTFSVYWIRCADHTDMMTQGYVGVSMDAERRWGEHQKSRQNQHFKFAIQKYGWDNLIKTPADVVAFLKYSPRAGTSTYSYYKFWVRHLLINHFESGFTLFCHRSRNHKYVRMTW